MPARVLVVEDDVTVAEVVCAYLAREGYEHRLATDGRAAAQVWQQWQPDVVVLDLMLPVRSGLDLLRRRRAEGDETYVIVLSALREEDDRVIGLEVGADDYLAKPFSPRELMLRVSALLRRGDRFEGRTLVPKQLVRGGLTIDLAARSATLAGRDLRLTARQLDLLAYLATYPGVTLTKHELLRRVWGWDFGDASTVAVHIRRLREKIEVDPSDPRWVLTASSGGYRFAVPDAERVPTERPGDPSTGGRDG
jgi:DNA-binding response OmpR family regulator